MSATIASRCAAIEALINEILDEIEAQPLVPLENIRTSRASGAYLLFTVSAEGIYSPWAITELPLYAGKTGNLQDRMSTHGESIEQVLNLHPGQFMAKFIELPDEYAHLACMFEAALIKRYRPLWNSDLKGFGLKAVGNNRTDSTISRWDTLHPGRPKRGEAPNDMAAEALMALVDERGRALLREHGISQLRDMSQDERVAADALSEMLVIF